MPNTKPKTHDRKFSFKMPEWMFDQLEQIAAADGESKGAVMRRLIVKEAAGG
jgi:hypothetical protein